MLERRSGGLGLYIIEDLERDRWRLAHARRAFLTPATASPYPRLVREGAVAAAASPIPRIYFARSFPREIRAFSRSLTCVNEIYNLLYRLFLGVPNFRFPLPQLIIFSKYYRKNYWEY
jgi:hypothetical protein